MESAKVCGWLAANFLLLALLMDPTAACMCSPQTPKEAYCYSDNLVKAKVLSAVDNEETFKRRYTIQITKVLKGPETLKDIPYLNTGLQSNLCGYDHPRPFNEEEYVFAVRQDGDHLSMSLCDFNKKWKDLSRRAKKALMGRYKKQCN